MPTPPQLVEALSAITGVSLPTVVDIDRKLAKANLRPVGGRGLHAARMSPGDAARLLTAVLASPQSNEAAEAVLRYTQTRPDKARSSKGLFGDIGLEDLGALTSKHSFIDALAALIASFSHGSLAIFAEGSAAMPRIEVYAFTHAIRGRIRISGLPKGLTANVEYVPTAGKTQGSNNTHGDLEQSRRMTERTIEAIADLFTQEDINVRPARQRQL